MLLFTKLLPLDLNSNQQLETWSLLKMGEKNKDFGGSDYEAEQKFS